MSSPTAARCTCGTQSSQRINAAATYRRREVWISALKAAAA
jgi:hypothetical protein